MNVRFPAMLLASLMLVVPAAAQTVSERQYRDTVARYVASHKGDASWKAVRKVRMPDGTVVDTDGDTEVDATLLAQALQLSPLPTDANVQARTILAAPKYQKVRAEAESALEKWIDQQYKRFTRWIAELRAPSPVGWLPKFDAAVAIRGILFFVAGAIGVVAVFTLVKRSGVLRRRRPAPASDPNLADPEITDPLGAAERAERESDYRQAVRLTYIAALHALRDAGTIALERHRTNGEYQAEVKRRDSALADALLPATRLFDRVWYGRVPATAAELAVARTQLNAVRQALDVASADPR